MLDCSLLYKQEVLLALTLINRMLLNSSHSIQYKMLLKIPQLCSPFQSTTDDNSVPVTAFSLSQPCLQTGAFVLTGRIFMSAQAIYDILSSENVNKLSIQRIPSGPKSNCYFILNIGKELTDFDSASSNRMKIQDRRRDGTGAWTDISTSNTCLYLVENEILKWV